MSGKLSDDRAAIEVVRANLMRLKQTTLEGEEPEGVLGVLLDRLPCVYSESPVLSCKFETFLKFHFLIEFFLNET